MPDIIYIGLSLYPRRRRFLERFGEVSLVSHRSSSKLVQQIEKAAEIVKSGGVVAFPTDTVYGLGANPFLDKAVDRIYEIKGRARHLPLPILLLERQKPLFNLAMKVDLSLAN